MRGSGVPNGAKKVKLFARSLAGSVGACTSAMSRRPASTASRHSPSLHTAPPQASVHSILWPALAARSVTRGM